MHILQLNIWWLFGQNLHPSEKTHTKVSCPGNSLHYMGGGGGYSRKTQNKKKHDQCRSYK